MLLIDKYILIKDIPDHFSDHIINHNNSDKHDNICMIIIIRNVANSTILIIFYYD